MMFGSGNLLKKERIYLNYVYQEIDMDNSFIFIQEIKNKKQNNYKKIKLEYINID